ncbi:MAG: SDR family NAD(P)-dependent oxidoreductase [Acidobacteria bacterium]|nr:SDR family NAD(P)-dependent oxidoreductase [Acidobacteriota bacterium]NIM64099.1 SDR family NAD(P)-dependent oxidoreductase [Acidobacteriota bacterium]NIO59399.1 SDR family NAD(P)-dependent oxidoreductase [Acidobacteriota bacterium]NIQ30433.1 SDR family NAD(P)-dependent oxidoreductase [Acidobacteriota bacterium]NIQ85365.1 SDR family NAD(P)-dependent oxidoreductase [Acidobacteriota bacterium]
MARTIVITGVSRGLGKALADRWIEAGHTVSGCSRGGDAENRVDAVDVGDDAAVGRWAREVLDRVGPPDLLVNNAGLINANAPLWSVPPDEFRRVVDTNVAGTYHTIRHFLPAMIEAGRGVIVNLSSGWGRGTAPEVAPYCATKWAVEGLTQSLAQELPPGLAAVTLNPGVIHTEMLESAFGASASAFPDPDAWASRAARFILEIGAKDNGKALTAP